MKGQEKLNPRFVLTTEQTSGCYSVGDYNFKAIYYLDPLFVKVIPMPNLIRDVKGVEPTYPAGHEA